MFHIKSNVPQKYHISLRESLMQTVFAIQIIFQNFQAKALVQLSSVDKAASYSSQVLHLLKSRNSVVKSLETKKNNAEFRSVLIKLSNAHMYNYASRGTAVVFP